MVHDVSWFMIFVFAIAINFGSWSYSYVALKFLNKYKYFSDTTPYNFTTFWNLTMGFFIAVGLFKWGW